MKNNLNSNLNNMKESPKKILRPKSVLKKEVGPIKILNKNQTKIENNNQNENNLITDENKEDLNTIKESRIVKNSTNNNNNYTTLNTNEDIFSENKVETELPLLTSNTINLQNKRAKTAKDRYKIKLENLESMFNAKPTFYYERSKKKLTLKKFGLVPGIPEELLPRLKLVFSIFKNQNIQPFIDKAP